MANVRYTSGGSSATLGTKTIDENGVYNAVDDDLDGYSQVTVDVPAPSGAVELSYTANGSYSENIEQYQTAEITVDVPIPTVNTQSKTVTATTSQQTVTPNPGYYLDSVTVNPQQHSATFTPNSDTAANDMGPVNNYRYVNTSGMINPTGTLEVEYTTNGPHTESVRQYENISIDIDVPVSGDLGTKTITVNGTYNAIDDNLDGYSEVDVNVPQNATLGIKTITNNGNYYATADGYDGFSRVDVNVPGAALQSSKTVTATTSQQTVTPDVGYDGLEQVIVDPQVHSAIYVPLQNEPYNDMGAQNNYRYVDTSGMVIPHPITPSNASPVALTSGNAVSPTGNGYAISSYSSVGPNYIPFRIFADDMIQVGNDGYIIEDYENVTPSSTPRYVDEYDIVRLGGSGVIVDSVPTPTSITPSNSSPVALSANTPVNPTESGYAIKSYSEVAPSNANPPSISNGGIYKIKTRNGLLISTASLVSPSDTNPPQLVVNDTYYRINGASGYLYSTVQPKVKTGTFQTSTSGEVTVTLGFQPKYLAFEGDGSSSSGKHFMYIYNADTSTSVCYFANASNYPTTRNMTSGNNNIVITSTGFKFTMTTSPVRTCRYFAIG